MDNPDRFYFPAWANKVATLLAGLSTIGGIYVVLIFNYGASPKTISAGYQPKQVVPFSHKLHAGELKMDCRYCHNTVETAARAAIPATATCGNCHSPADEKGIVPLTAVHARSPKLAPIHASLTTGEPVLWTKVHDLPDYVFFNHSAHVMSGVSCVQCHGRIDQMEVVQQMKPLSMGWCLDCHRDHEKNLVPLDKVTDLAVAASLTVKNENENERYDFGKNLSEQYNIHPKTNCSTCHR